MDSKQLTKQDVELLNSKLGLYTLLKSKKTNLGKALEEVKYTIELENDGYRLLACILNDESGKSCLNEVQKQNLFKKQYYKSITMIA